LIASLREVADVLQVRPVQIFKMHLAADGTVDRRVGYNRTGYADGGWTFPTNLFKPAVKRWQLVTWAGSSMMTEIAGTSGAQHSRFLFDADP
jgi:hypothetical protein